MLAPSGARGLVTAALVAVALVLWGRFVEPRLLTVTRRTLEMAGLPAGLDGTRIALLADLHGESFGPGQARIRMLLEREQPHVLVFAGDLVDFSRGGLEEGLELLRVMAAQGPVLAIWGNHDHQRDLPAIRAGVAAAGIKVIDLEETLSFALKLAGGTLAFAAMPRSWLRQVAPIRPAVTAARAASPPGSPVVVVMHSPGPEKVDLAAAAGADLIVAGHTHGGQICAPVIGPLWVPGQGIRPPLAWGLHRVAGAWVFVTRGLGTSVLPIRFLCPPEVVVLTLRSVPADSAMASAR